MTMQIDIAGEALELLPARAAWWPRQRLLVVADVHFGKAAAFRAGGLPVPHGTTSQNLAALDTLLASRPARGIVFLGDFLHARSSRAGATLAALRAWRLRQADLALTLVRGNHDAQAGDPPADLGLAIVDEPWQLDPFAFGHHPRQSAGPHLLCGHLHPVHHLAWGGERLRLPCFVVGPQRTVLPAFGAFTGGHPVTPADDDRLFVATDDAVFAVPR